MSLIPVLFPYRKGGGEIKTRSGHKVFDKPFSLKKKKKDSMLYPKYCVQRTLISVNFPCIQSRALGELVCILGGLGLGLTTDFLPLAGISSNTKGISVPSAGTQ